MSFRIITRFRARPTAHLFNVDRSIITAKSLAKVENKINGI